MQHSTKVHVCQRHLTTTGYHTTTHNDQQRRKLKNSKKNDLSVREWQLSLCRHYKSCGKSHGKESLKRKALRRPRKTDIEGMDVTCWGRLFQVYGQQQQGRPDRRWWTAMYDGHSGTLLKKPRAVALELIPSEELWADEGQTQLS